VSNWFLFLAEVYSINLVRW